MWGSDLAQLPVQFWLERYVPTPPVLRTSHFPTQVVAARAGLGVVLVPEPYGPRHDLVPVEHAAPLREA